jgi:formate dehydrogenase major subunit
MKVTRRDFLKITGGSALGAAVLGLGIDLKPIESHALNLKLRYAQETTSICCYCAVGCGVIVHTGEAGAGKVVNIEGDPDHPINEGALCSKGASLSQLVNNESRITTPLYRRPYGSRWEPISWEQALWKIALRVKKSRDESFSVKNDKGQVVNRTNGIAHIGSAALDNEECWLVQAMMRALGLVYIEHQARI